MKSYLLVLLLGSLGILQMASSANTASGAPPVAPAVTVNLLADFNGWNYSQPSGDNPTVSSARLFVGETLQVNLLWADVPPVVHNFAIYVPGTTYLQVDLSNLKTCNRTMGCLVESNPVSLESPQDSVTFTTSNFGRYEYYCEYHADIMHGQIQVSKSPDINGDRSVNIIDLAQVGAAFGAIPSSPNWNPNADMNFDSVINIIDLAIVAANFGRTL